MEKNLTNPIGKAVNMPAIPIKRSITSDAAHTAPSTFRRIAPANRTTSPPMVVGRKLDANRPAKERRTACPNEISTFAERRRLNQRKLTASLDNRVNPNNNRKTGKPTTDTAPDTVCQPSRKSRYTNSPSDITVPAMRKNRDLPPGFLLRFRFGSTVIPVSGGRNYPTTSLEEKPTVLRTV